MFSLAVNRKRVVEVESKAVTDAKIDNLPFLVPISFRYIKLQTHF